MLNPDYKEMLSALLAEGVDFVLVGAYALAAHGFPRATGDIDILIRPQKENAQKVFKALVEFGAPLNKISQADFEKEGTVFQIGVPPRRIDILNEITGVSYESAARDKVIVEIEGLKIPVISKKKLIQNKESTGRDKDVLDARKLKGS